jgi:hypothetical protein
MSSSSNALFELPEWEAILNDEGVADLSLLPRRPLAGEYPPLSHIADLSFRLYHIPLPATLYKGPLLPV